MRKINTYSIAFALLLVGSAIQFGDYIVVRYFVPMLSVITAIFLLLSPFVLRKNKIVENVFYVHCVCFLLLTMVSMLGLADSSEVFFDIVKLFLAFASSFLIFYTCVFASNKTLFLSFSFTIFVVILIFLLDAIVRLEGFDYSRFTQNFYVYKLNSPFFVDSNALALYGLFYFALFFYSYNHYFQHKHWFHKIVLLMITLFMLLTISRSSIIALLALFLFHWYFTRKFNVKVLLLLMSPLVLVTILPYLLEIMSSDGSGLTKFGIYQVFWDKFWQVGMRDALFGYGINEGNYAYSYQEGAYSHALIPMIVGQFGFFGLLIYLSFFGYFIWLSRGHSLYVFLPAFVAGLSYLHPFLESFFLANSLVAGLYLRKTINTSSF